MIKANLDGKEIELKDSLEKGEIELDTLDGFIDDENDDGDEISDK